MLHLPRVLFGEGDWNRSELNRFGLLCYSKSTLWVPVVVDNHGCNGNEDINFRKYELRASRPDMKVEVKGSTQLIDRGKVDAKDVPLEIGISPDRLTANINEAHMAPDVRHKIANWLKAHVYASAFQKGSKVKFKPASASTDEGGDAHGSENLPISDSGLLDPVAVKTVPPRRKTVSNIKILMDNKMICPSEGVTGEKGMLVTKIRVGQPDQNPGSLNEAFIPNASEMVILSSKSYFTSS
ncbi:hypothetical protein RIF29_03866 [Crotalaria pallida]|uniref:Uncharacterized protein n=1 Tax=Crotalaria pallida TaxID=3830 RepID=A0AAN9J0E8_CROPI